MSGDFDCCTNGEHTPSPRALIAELRGFAEGSNSARATLMRDAADALEGMAITNDVDLAYQRRLEAQIALCSGSCRVPDFHDNFDHCPSCQAAHQAQGDPA